MTRRMWPELASMDTFYINGTDPIYLPPRFNNNLGGTQYIQFIMKTRLLKYVENFTSKNWKFSDKKSLKIFIFLLKT